jgi:DNA gyrase inhibitor GyrI
MDITQIKTSQVSIETLEPLHVACHQMVSKEPEIDNGIFLNGWLARQGVVVPNRHFGFDIEVRKNQQEAGLRGYETWVTVPYGVQPSEGVQIKDFSGGLYATMLLVKPFDDPHAHIPAGWKKLHEWMISSDQYRCAGHQWMEELITHPEGNDLKLYYPVKAAQA